MLKIIFEVKFYKTIRISDTTPKFCFNINKAMCNISHERLFTQNVTNVTFSFETSPNTNPTRKSGGTWHIMSPRLKKWKGHVPRVPHQIAPLPTFNMLSLGHLATLFLDIYRRCSFSGVAGHMSCVLQTSYLQQNLCLS